MKLILILLTATLVAHCQSVATHTITIVETDDATGAVVATSTIKATAAQFLQFPVDAARFVQRELERQHPGPNTPTVAPLSVTETIKALAMPLIHPPPLDAEAAAYQSQIADAQAKLDAWRKAHAAK